MSKFLGKMNKGYFFAALITVIAYAVIYYLALPAFNVHSLLMWLLLISFVVVLGFTMIIFGETKKRKLSLIDKVLAGVFFALVLLLVVGFFSSTKIFRAKDYAQLLTVREQDFAETVPETTDLSDISLMDTATAKTLGARAVGQLSDVVSQYVISDSYSTIDYNGTPMKVAPLEYESFFKFVNNKSDGIPGYVLVDPVKNQSSYIELENPIRYSPSAYFGNNLERHLRMAYPTYLFKDYYFELDNNGNPYWICPVESPQVGLFGAKDIIGVVICDPCNGSTEYYAVGNVPQWVDRVYDGDLLQQKYDWYGTLSGGFWNSIIGNVGCKVTTDDYGYKVMNGDVWIYTGVTSVTSDESNIGFVLMNSRTAETQYFAVAGAEEHSAMEAAEGELQNLGYTASFPSLINIDGQPTYIMAMKDNGGLVKMYALVNIEKYSIVATGSTTAEAVSAYRKMLREQGVIDDGANGESLYTEEEITVAQVRFLESEDTLYCYLTDTEGNVYRAEFTVPDTEVLVKLREGSQMSVTYDDSSTDDAAAGIRVLIDFTILQV